MPSSVGEKERKRNRWGPINGTATEQSIFRPPSAGVVSRPLPPFPTSSSDPSSLIFLPGHPPNMQYPNPIFSHQTTSITSLSIPPPPPPPRHTNNQRQHGLASRWIPPPPPPPRIPPPPPPRNSVTGNGNGSVIAQLRTELDQIKTYASSNPTNTATTVAGAPDTAITNNDSDMEESDDETGDRRSTSVQPATIDVDFHQQASLIFQDAMFSQPSPFLPLTKSKNDVPSYEKESRMPPDPQMALKSGNKDIKSTAFEQSHQQGTDQAAKLRLAKEKLRHAHAKLVSALKGKKIMNLKRCSSPDAAALPPITALSQDLRIRDFSGPAHLVEFLPEVELLQAGKLDVLPANISEDDEVEGQHKSPPNLQQQGHTLRKSLLLLKKKKLELTLKMQQRLGPTSASSTKEDTSAALLINKKETVPVRPPLNKEALKKRQEELQHTVDTAYWKRLILKQRNLLATSQEKLAHLEVNLQTCRCQMVVTKQEIVECEDSLAETTVREECLNNMISRSTQRVLTARMKRLDAMNEADKKTKKRRREEQKQDATNPSSNMEFLACVDDDLT